HWFNQMVSDTDRPWVVGRSDLNSIDEKHHEIRIKTRLSKEEARTEIIRMVAQARWQATGLPQKPDESDDILTQTLYQHCQHRWFDHEFGQTGVDVNRIFPLTEEQKQTLKMSANQPYLQEADRRISAWNSHGVQWSPELWHQMSDLLNHLVDDFVNEASAVGSDNAPEPLTVVDAKAHEQYVPQHTDKALTAADTKAHEQYVPQHTDKALTAADVKAPEKYIPEACGIQAPALDQMTDYESHGKSKVYDYKIFDMQNHSSGIYRKRVRDVHVTAEGEVKQIDINDRHMQGVEVLIPALLPGENQEVTLTENQTLGTLNDTSFNGRYSLPSLTPDDYIVGLRIKPDLPFTLVRDRYSGLHTLCFHEIKPLYIEQLTYVVEHRKPGKKTPAPAKGAKPEPSTRFDAHCSEGMKTVLEEVLTAIGEQPIKAQEGLRAIKNAQNATQRIEAIADYCMAFSGEAEPEAKENFFRFLVTQQQGSCRHRVPVFVAFCRYFEIPCRQIGNGVHTFAEYSLDGGLTWKSMHLGGAPVESTGIKPEFQPIRRVSGSDIVPKKVRDLLKGADSEQRKILAKAHGMNLDELNKAIETDSALLPTHLNISEIVQSLWKEKNLASFSMGVSLLESLDTKVLGPEEKSLVCDVICEDELIYSYEAMPEAMREKLFNDKLGTNEEELICDEIREVQRTYTYRPMQEAIREILSNDNEDQVIEPLKSLYSKMIVQAGANPQHWLSSMVDILKFSDLTRPSVMQLAREALKSGWLNPPTTYEDKMLKAAHHALLVGLEDIDELKAQAAHCLKSWYKNLLSREKNSQAWRSAYKNFQKEEDNAFFMTHCHDGVSHSLESQILNVSLQTVWTDEPEGIPDIERMLAHDPAFVQLNSGRPNQRPVIITGQPFWRRTALNEKVAALLQRQAENNPDLKLILEKVNKYEEMNKELRNVLKALNKLKRELDDLRLMRPGETDDNQSTLLYDQYQAKEQEYEKKRLDIKSDLESLRVQREEKKLANNLTKKYKLAIQQAFSHYLYGVTHSKGGCLSYCWADASIAVVGAWDSISHGAHDPSSPEELHAMMSAIDNSCWLQEVGKDACLRQAHNASNALILKPDELTNIAEEFLNSVNLDSIYESFHN
ncbi:transglutaminase domain-containing protein, partial [Endozoicomonas sp. SESOKO2]|uniref:transglutaminase domain-containing protein n=1 Tax=Endozoicomonas sp. SESOKO2 TaxID=2828743 RepID=UPI00214755E7